MANKAIKYRVYPTTEQSIMFAKTFGCCRKVYNLMLSDKIEGYKATGKFPTVTPAKYKDEYPYLREVDSLALANKQMDLQEAFRNRFSKSRKKNNGFPKYKSAKHSSKRLENYLNVVNDELKTFARITGNNNIHNLSNYDIVTTNNDIAKNTNIKHV